MNAHTKMSAKGQVVIPKAVRERRGWTPGAELEIVETAQGLLLRAAARPRQRISVDEFLRLLPAHEGPPATLEEMDEAIERAMAERWKAKEARSR